MVRCRNLLVSYGILLICAAQSTYGNIFLNGEYANDVNAFLSDQAHINQIDMEANPFLSHAISSRAAGFQGPQYLPPVEKQQLLCSGQEVCVRKNQCSNGYFTNQNFGSQRQDCDYNTEVCCSYKPSPTQPPVQSTPCSGLNYDCVPPNLCSNGQITQTGYVKQQQTDKCYAPEVCCKIPDSTILTDEGYVVRTPEKPFPQPVPQPRPTPSRPQPTPQRPQPQPTQPRQPTPQRPQPQPTQPRQPTPQRPQPQPTQPRQPTPQRPQPQPTQPRQPTPQRPQPQPTQPRQPTPQRPQPQPTPSRPIPQPQPTQPRQPVPRPQPTQPRIPQPQPTLDRGYLPPGPTQPPRQPGTQPPRQPGTQPPRQPGTQPPRQPQTQPPNQYIPPQTGEGILSLPIYPSKKPGQPVQPVFSNDLPEIQLPTKCAAALNCTRSEYCSATGVISDSPVVLTEDQEIYRVPMTSCYNPEQGFNGVCCRDPNYTDPWPASQLGQYKAELFGDTGAYKPSSNDISVRQQRRVNPAQALGQSQPARRQASNRVARCASRNFDSVLRGDSPINAAFGEYPWQAMILLESKKALICGGVIIADDLVATSAHCVQKRKPFDVIIKGGEWKLGSDIEPVTYQNSRVKRIELHPNFNAETLSYDIALLHLDSKLKFDTHIAPLCIDDEEPTENDRCFVTGWGKEVLKVHLQDAIMNHANVTIYDRQYCEAGTDQLCGQSDINACDLDFGSALACTDGTGRWVMKGIYSTSNGCEDSSLITFAKPDATWMNPANRNARGYSTNYLTANRY